MPELPEVETVRRGLTPAMADATFVRVEQRRPDLRFPFPADFAGRLGGRRVVRLERRSKYLKLALDSGETLVMHLGMSGRFTVAPAESHDPASDAGGLGRFTHNSAPAEPHDHVVFHMSSGATVTYNDPRRFGFMLLIASDEVDRHKLFASLGIEPLGDAFTADALRSVAAGRSVDLKALLLDQSAVAGLGNIYVAEALHEAGLSPRRSAASLASRSPQAAQRRDRLVTAIRSVLERAVAAGGSTLRDHQQTDGTLGYFQNQHRVYDRAGEACLLPGCRGTVRRIVQSGRSTFWCPGCQT